MQGHQIHPPEKRLEEFGLLSLKEKRTGGSDTVLEDLLKPKVYHRQKKTNFIQFHKRRFKLGTTGKLLKGRETFFV